MELDYEKDMEIDPDALDTEWLAQPALSLRYGRHLIELQEEEQRAVEKKKTIRSELIQEVSEDPNLCCGKDKPNAADIEAFYRTSKSYKEAVAAQNKIINEVAYAMLAKNEICYTRKAALEHLVILHGQQYFAGPRVPRDISKEWVEKKKQMQANETVVRNMKRKENKKK